MLKENDTGLEYYGDLGPFSIQNIFLMGFFATSFQITPERHSLVNVISLSFLLFYDTSNSTLLEVERLWVGVIDILNRMPKSHNSKSPEIV